VTVVRQRDKEPQNQANKGLRRFILTSFQNERIIPDPVRRIVLIGDEMQIPVQDEAIDKLAKESGLVIGKWLVYVSKDKIDETWKVIASSTFKGELGIDAKVSTASRVPLNDRYVICVYTKNYLDVEDVDRVREMLRKLGFVARLYYKPDIYTYLKIYKKTFPDIKASRYSS